jgi:hypothetical protein
LHNKIGSHAAIKYLSIFSGAMNTLPESLRSLKKLKSFSLDAYNIKKLPDWFKKLSYVKEKDIEIGKEEGALSQRNVKKKQGIASFKDFTYMGYRYRWKLLESYTIKEIESVICSAPEYSVVRGNDMLAFRDMMLARRRKLNSKFRWTQENKMRIAKVSDEFLKAWEEGFAKAKMFIDALYEKEQNKDKDYFEEKYRVEIVLFPAILNYKEDGTFTEEQLYFVITDYLNSKEELSIHIGSDPEKIEDDFRQNIRIKRDLSWNIEGLGDIALEDHYICYALHIIYSHNEWALEDIAKINNISSEIRVYCEGAAITS